MKPFFPLLLLLFVSAIYAQPNIVVSPDGPVTSLNEAREKVRKLPRGNEPIVVEFQSGHYLLSEPVVFQPEDSGTDSAPIIYRAGKGQDVTFSGGREISGFKPNGQTPGGWAIWSTMIPEVAQGKWYFEQLYVDGKRATRCREPNENYFYTEDQVDMIFDPAQDKIVSGTKSAFVGSSSELNLLAKVPRERWNDLVFILYHAWETSAHRVSHIDFDQRTILFTGPAAWPLMRWEPRQRYYMENFKEALDQPGEWFLDRDGTLSYIPLPGEDPAKMRFVAPVAESLLHFEGNTQKASSEGRVRQLAFENLKFKYAGYRLPPGGHSDGQAAIRIPFAIRLDGCEQIRFEQCEFAHLGGNGIRFHRACKKCRFIKNYVHDLGAGAVYLGRNDGDPNIEETEHIEVTNNIIREGGFFDRGGIPLWIGHGSHHSLTHNDISEFHYTGISVGWQWGYQPSRSHHNRIEFNHIHHLGHWILSDMGAVYTLGVSPGTTVSNNVMHDVYAYSYGGWGLYTDEGSTGIVMENNLVYRVKTGTFHQHYGKENIIRNNILACSLTDQIQRSRIEQHLSFTLENNIILWEKGAVLFGHPWNNNALAHWGDANVMIKNNLYWNPDADMNKVFPGKDSSGTSLEQWRQITGHDQGSQVGNPKFNDYTKGDFTLPDDSPAFQVGFKRFEYSKAGVFGDESWVRLARDYVHPPRPMPPPKPAAIPLKINDDFETPRSKPIRKCVLSDEKRGLIRISTENPFQGEKCLEIADADDLKHAWDPHLYMNPDYSEGEVVLQCAIRIRKNASVMIELRDQAKPYKVGPGLRIQNEKLTLKGTNEIHWPNEQWIQCRIVFQLGKKNQQKWSLEITRPDGTNETYPNLPYVHDDFNALKWLGFCNLARTGDDASFFIDNLTLENRTKSE